jgi:hypothetical protein
MNKNNEIYAIEYSRKITIINCSDCLEKKQNSNIIASILPKTDWIWYIATIIINYNEMIKLQNIYKIQKI